MMLASEAHENSNDATLSSSTTNNSAFQFEYKSISFASIDSLTRTASTTFSTSSTSRNERQGIHNSPVFSNLVSATRGSVGGQQPFNPTSELSIDSSPSSPDLSNVSSSPSSPAESFPRSPSPVLSSPPQSPPPSTVSSTSSLSSLVHQTSTASLAPEPIFFVQSLNNAPLGNASSSTPFTIGGDSLSFQHDNLVQNNTNNNPSSTRSWPTKSNPSSNDQCDDPHVLQDSSNDYVFVGSKYVLFEQIEGSNWYRCFETESGHSEELVCRVMPNHPSSQGLLFAHLRVDGSPYINQVQEVIRTDSKTYLIFPKSNLDLHSYVRQRRRLKEHQARHLFKQIVSAVHEAHSKGIVLRDLKLRKFIFMTESRYDIQLESLEDSVVLEDFANDYLTDKHGCPAYVSPEILRGHYTKYSGRAADMWGLGVMLYTMLVGRYPFHGQEHSGLFAKIRRGHFSLPDNLSSRAKCLIRCLLRKEPSERLTTEDVLAHPWLTRTSSSRDRLKRASHSLNCGLDSVDQVVPEAHKEQAKKSAGVKTDAKSSQKPPNEPRANITGYSMAQLTSQQP